jgi:hypothetical protein
MEGGECKALSEFRDPAAGWELSPTPGKSAARTFYFPLVKNDSFIGI